MIDFYFNDWRSLVGLDPVSTRMVILRMDADGIEFYKEIENPEVTGRTFRHPDPEMERDFYSFVAILVSDSISTDYVVQAYKKMWNNPSPWW